MPLLLEIALGAGLIAAAALLMAERKRLRFFSFGLRGVVLIFDPAATCDTPSQAVEGTGWVRPPETPNEIVVDQQPAKQVIEPGSVEEPSPSVETVP